MQLRTSEYNIGWFCALAVEEDAVIKLLDESLDPPSDLPITRSGSLYNYGMMGNHRVVIRTLPTGSPDNAVASAAIHLMREQFPGIEHFLFSGIAGGLPGEIHQTDSFKNIHLGDVVIATPGNGHSGIINNTVHKITSQGKEVARMTDKTSPIWRNASDYFVNKYNRDKTILRCLLGPFPRPPSQDHLFLPDSRHLSRRYQECNQCRTQDLVDRPIRTDEIFPRIFQAALVIGGLIRDGLEREKISCSYPDARAVDMESSGIVEGFGSLIVRGISDYADSHKSDEWQEWAAGRAAAVAKAILLHANIQAPKSVQPISDGYTKNSISYRLDIDYLLCKDFCGYDAVVASLEQSLITHRDSRQQKRIIVLYGHAGTGKSAACDEFYTRNCDHFWGAWRINASSESNIMEGMLNILADLDNTELHPTGSTLHNPMKQVMQHLKRVQKAWLLIFENADQNFPYISTIPSNERGSTIIISRQPECCALERSSSIAMPRIDEEEAIKLLWFLVNVHHIDIDSTTKATVRAVVKRLHCFPMAIRAASSTIINDSNFGLITIEQNLLDYLVRLEEVPGPSHALQSLWGSQQNDERMPYATMTTFSSLLDGIKRQQSTSRTANDAFELLDVFGFWSSGGIPGSLLKAILQYQLEMEALDEELEYFPDILKIGSAGLSAQMSRIAQAISLLRRFSLLTHIDRGQKIEDTRWHVHPIFQECLRVSKFMSLEQGRKSTLRSLVLLSCCAAAKKVPNVRGLRRSVLPHLEAIERVAQQLTKDKWFTLLFEDLKTTVASAALLNCSIVYFDSGKLIRAIEQQRYVYAKLKESDANNNEISWQAQSYLATSLHDLRNRSAAKGLREELVRNIETETQGRTNASHHKLYTNSLADLADSYDVLPAYHLEAVSLREQVLKALEAAGSTSTNLLYAKQRLARSCHLAGQETRALLLRKEILEFTKHLPDRPEMKLDALGELAESLQAKGFWQQAMDLRLIHELEASRLLGQEHPDVLAAKLNLAASFTVMDRKEEARQLRRTVYESRLAILDFGADAAGNKLPHPVTLHALGMVARSERDCGEEEEALNLLNQVVAAWNSYPSEIRSDYREDYLNHKRALAKLVEKQVARLKYHNPKAAEEHYKFASKHREEVLQIQKDAFGESSKETLLASTQVALSFVAKGDLRGAFEHVSEIMHKYKKSFLGDEHGLYDKNYLVILRYHAEICERLSSSQRPRPGNTSYINTIPLEDIAPTLSASSSSQNPDGDNNSMAITTSDSDSVASGMELSTEPLQNSMPWQDIATNTRRDIVTRQCARTDQVPDFNQSALEDAIKLGSALMQTNRAEALEYYRQAIRIMERPERLGRSHSRVQELFQKVEPWIGVLRWLGIPTVDCDATRENLTFVAQRNITGTSLHTAGSLD